MLDWTHAVPASLQLLSQARIEALMAALPEAAPRPVAQPSVVAALQSGQSRRTSERAIIHLDMDCFFASIAMQARPWRPQP